MSEFDFTQNLNSRQIQNFSHCVPTNLILINFTFFSALNGDFIGVYQDVYLQMLETEDADLLDEDIEMQNAETDLEFIVNQPFMAILQVDHEILAVGRIKDPLWCKTCSEKPQGYIDISNEMMFDKDYVFSASDESGTKSETKSGTESETKSSVKSTSTAKTSTPSAPTTSGSSTTSKKASVTNFSILCWKRCVSKIEYLNWKN